MELEVYKKSDFYEDYISSQKEYYERANADAYFAERLAEKDREIAKLKEKLMPCLNGDCILTCEVVEKYGKENAKLKADVNNLLMQNQELCQALQAMYSAEEYMELQAEKDKEIALLKERICNGDVSRLTWIDDCIAKDKEIAELKQNLEDAKATAYADSVDAGMRERRLKRALLLARAERYKMREFIAREEGNLCNQMSWSRFLRERTYSQWVDQLLRIANLANKLQNKCLAKAEEYK